MSEWENVQVTERVDVWTTDETDEKLEDYKRVRMENEVLRAAEPEDHINIWLDGFRLTALTHVEDAIKDVNHEIQDLLLICQTPQVQEMSGKLLMFAIFSSQKPIIQSTSNLAGVFRHVTHSILIHLERKTGSPALELIDISGSVNHDHVLDGFTSRTRRIHESKREQESHRCVIRATADPLISLGINKVFIRRSHGSSRALEVTPHLPFTLLMCGTCWRLLITQSVDVFKTQIQHCASL